MTSSPAFAGTPTAPTASVTTNTTQVATTAFVQNNKDSPAFTGTPTAPTAVLGTSTTQIATTAFVRNQISNLGTLSLQNANSVSITGGNIRGLITALPIESGGTNANTIAGAQFELGVPPNARTITAAGGLTGGGDLSANRTIAIASNSNGYGTRYVSTSAPNIPGINGDIWYQIL